MLIYVNDQFQVKPLSTGTSSSPTKKIKILKNACIGHCPRGEDFRNSSFLRHNYEKKWNKKLHAHLFRKLGKKFSIFFLKNVGKGKNYAEFRFSVGQFFFQKIGILWLSVANFKISQKCKKGKKLTIWLSVQKRFWKFKKKYFKAIFLKNSRTIGNNQKHSTLIPGCDFKENLKSLHGHLPIIPPEVPMQGF